MVYVAQTCRPSNLPGGAGMVWNDVESSTLEGLKAKLKALATEWQVIRVFIRYKINHTTNTTLGE